MAIEPCRGCGYRKIGALYLVGPRSGMGCCKLPIELHVCPTCNNGIKQSRNWQWIDPRPWLGSDCKLPREQARCPAARPETLGERVGLIWIGEQFYPTAESFIAEADALGISRRIKVIPRGFRLGEHWVFLAHPKAIIVEGEYRPGIFRLFKPVAIEKLVTETQSRDEEEMEKLQKMGVTPVIVPDDDRDHRGSIWDKREEQEQEQARFTLATID